MATEMFVRNLPEGTTEEFLREYLSNSVEIIKIEFVPDPNPNTTNRQAVIVVNLPLYEAEQLANRFNGRVIDGQTLRVAASLYDSLESRRETDAS